MYDVSVTNGDVTQYIHNHRATKDNQKIASGQIVDAVNEISSFTFEIYPSNDGYEFIYPYKSIVKVYNNDKQRFDFIGRVLQITPQMETSGMISKTVVCESILGVLCDTVQPYVQEHQYAGDANRNGLQEFIDLLLGNHNAQVDDAKKIYRGDVTVTTFESEGVYKGLDYETTFNAFKSKCLDSFGGEIKIRTENGINYLDYKPSIGVTRATAIRVGRNMQSAKKDVNPTSIATRLIPLGAKLTEITVDADGNEVESENGQRLTIESVNGGKRYIEDAVAKDLYGIIYKTVSFDDVTEPLNLYNKGVAYMAESNTLTVSHTISALDLSIIGLDIDDFVLYDSYNVQNPLIGLNDTLEIIKKTTDILQPHTSSFEMGDKSVSLSDQLITDSNAVKNVQSTVSQITTTIKNDTESLYTYVDNSFSSITQENDALKATVENQTVSIGEYDTFTETVRNILAMDADGTTMLFQTIMQAIEEVNGVASTNYSEILKYIRFVGGDILLGEVENALQLRIQNDRISFLQNNVEVAYFSDNKLHVTDGEFLSSLKIGKFAFVPRSNGNTSFKVVS